MNKKYLLILAISTCSFLNIFANEINEENTGFISHINEVLNTESCDISKSLKNNKSTAIIYQYGVDGFLWHVAVFEDGCVATCLGGPNFKKQEIYINGNLVDFSWNYKKHNNKKVTYKYSWGSVDTWENQVVVRT